MQCFQKDPNLRVSARKLLKHPWIVNARRSDSIVPTNPPKYDEAVKSVQQWNAALKSPDANSLRKASGPQTGSPIPGRLSSTPSQTPPAAAPAILAPPKTRALAETFRSPAGHQGQWCLGSYSPPLFHHRDRRRHRRRHHNGSSVPADDNWDDDFDSSISSSALQLQHLRPHDHFGGMLSAERLKLFASSENVSDKENWDDQFEGDLTVRSPSRPTETDPLLTIRPHLGKEPDIHVAPSSPRRGALRPARARPLTPPRPRPATPPLPLPSRPTALFREESVEDYSDLIPPSDGAFEQKVGVLRVRKVTPSSSLSLTLPASSQRADEDARPSRMTTLYHHACFIRPI